jgi:hypothetical protein
VTAIHADQSYEMRPLVRGRVITIASSRGQIDQFLMPRMGIDFPRNLSYERWLDIGLQLAALSASSAWCLGDWLVHGEHTYSGRYRDAIERTSLDYKTLRNYAWVARSFPLSRRRDTLSFAHHAEVAGLPAHEQDFWLRKAEEFSWSRNRLRQELRDSMSERSVAGDAAAKDGVQDRDVDAVPLPVEEAPFGQLNVPGVQIQIKLSPEQLESCRVAAGRLGQSIEEWAALALERAARNELYRKNGLLRFSW